MRRAPACALLHCVQDGFADRARRAKVGAAEREFLKGERQMSLDGPVRRIVTTHDKSGKAVALVDAISPPDPKPDATSWHMWATDSSPVKSSGNKDLAENHAFHPPKNGTQFRLVEFKPTGDVSKLDPQFIINFFGLQKLAKRAVPVRHPLMHRSASVDYAIVLSGEIVMLLDDTEFTCKAGDVIIQQATNHAWVNRSYRPCRIAFILMDGEDPLAPKARSSKTKSPKARSSKRKPAKAKAKAAKAKPAKAKKAAKKAPAKKAKAKKAKKAKRR